MRSTRADVRNPLLQLASARRLANGSTPRPRTSSRDVLGILQGCPRARRALLEKAQSADGALLESRRRLRPPSRPDLQADPAPGRARGRGAAAGIMLAVKQPSPAEIRAAREAAGLTQTAAAELVHAELRTWQHWESKADRGRSARDAARRLGALPPQDERHAPALNSPACASRAGRPSRPPPASRAMPRR
jgi:hypothetical protein